MLGKLICIKCAYGEFSANDAPEGSCRRYAPRLNGETWPVVKAGDWCGEWHVAPKRHITQREAAE